MKIGTMVVAAVAMMLGALAAAPAGAQEGREGGAIGYPIGGEPPPPPPDYAYRDGEVYVDGDEMLDCRTFAQSFDGGYDEFGDQAQAERVLERCERAGFPSADPPPEVRAEIRADRHAARDAARDAEQLPATGGVPTLPLATGVLLAGSGLLVLRARAG